MKRNKLISGITLFVGMLFLFSCGDLTQNNTAGNSSSEDEIQEVPIDEVEQSIFDEVEASHAWVGTYEGLLPCADCEGIETTIILNDDNTYQKLEVYLKGGEKHLFEVSGKFDWDETISRIALNPTEGSSRDDVFLYKVEEGKLRALDMDGEEVTSALAEHYVLEKVE